MFGYLVLTLRHSKSDILQAMERKTDILYFFCLDPYTQSCNCAAGQKAGASCQLCASGSTTLND